MQETFKSFLPTARTSSTVLDVPFHPEISPFLPGPLEKGALESPSKLEELDRQEEVRILNVHLLVHKWLVLYHVSCRLHVLQEGAADCSCCFCAEPARHVQKGDDIVFWLSRPSLALSVCQACYKITRI